MNLLQQWEKHQYLPKWWFRNKGEVRIWDLKDNQLLQPDTPKEELTGIFIYAGLHILHLQELGYETRFIDLAKESGFEYQPSTISEIASSSSHLGPQITDQQVHEGSLTPTAGNDQDENGPCTLHRRIAVVNEY
ncbi:uncharacterized protein L201_006251 [Kwoniella dendrophila CBS 6074]|uniref:Uncharacterized protein n=1 Tax=Kwoniella dendrophila CBS 6074 TaxID=1295534 RepID=A0AAX4K2I0_9TREE